MHEALRRRRCTLQRIPLNSACFLRPHIITCVHQRRHVLTDRAKTKTCRAMAAAAHFFEKASQKGGGWRVRSRVKDLLSNLSLSPHRPAERRERESERPFLHGVSSHLIALQKGHFSRTPRVIYGGHVLRLRALVDLSHRQLLHLSLNAGYAFTGIRSTASPQWFRISVLRTA